MGPSKEKPTVFISYSHKDEEVWKVGLRPHLEALALQERLVIWDDRRIDGGEEWYTRFTTLWRERRWLCA